MELIEKDTLTSLRPLALPSPCLASTPFSVLSSHPRPLLPSSPLSFSHDPGRATWMGGCVIAIPRSYQH